jgi:fatty-acyl-CoA synthase
MRCDRLTGPRSPPLLDMTIGVNLAATTAAHGGRDALIDVHSGRRWTYTEFRTAVRRVATGLLAPASAPATGDRVGICSPNTPDWPITQYTTAEIGAILVTINPAYRAHELEYVLNQAGVRDGDHRGGLQNLGLRGPAQRGATPLPQLTQS